MDAVGNVYRSRTGTDRRYGPGGRLEMADGIRYEHDEDGNQTLKSGPDGDWHYRWNGHGMLREVERPDGVRVAFDYDPFARRTAKRTLSAAGTVDQEVQFVWDGHNVIHELDSDRGLISWQWEPESFAPIAKEHAGRRWTIASDHLGTPTEMYDEVGQLAWKMQLDVFGVPRFDAGTAEDCPWRWPGQYEDPSIALYYNRRRHFSPAAGQYLSTDPMHLDGGFRQYGSPVSPDWQYDPFGENTWLGDIGEDFARQMFESRGYTVLGAVQNNSGHGIDLVVRRGDGPIRIAEVKVNSSRMSVAQADGPHLFGTSRAGRAISGHPGWGSVDQSTRDLAQEVLDAAKAADLEGFHVHVDVDAATGNVTGASVRRWCN
jgi:RHS repeat-associated protein